VIQEHAEAVNVAGDGGGLTVENLWRQIQRGPDQPWFRQQMLRPDLAGAEIHQDHAATGFAHDIVRFDVAMEETSLVHGGDGATDINPDERRFLTSEQSPRGQHLREREAFDPLHPQADGSLVLVDAVNGDDVRMPDTREQATFLDDGPGSVGRSQDLQSDFAFERGIPGPIHRAKTPVGDLLAELERSPSARRGLGRASKRVSSRGVCRLCEGWQLADHVLRVGGAGRRLSKRPWHLALGNDHGWRY
jgi:hypothetical protein